MSISLPGRTVVFDYGEVISKTPHASVREAIVALADVEPEPFWAAYDANRDSLDSGEMSVVEYWRALARATGTEWSLSRIHELWALDFPAWISPEPGTIDIIEELRDGGTPVCVLSNAGFDFGSPLRFSPVGTLFDRVFVSAEMHDLKPSASIYRTVLDELGITPEQMVFIDNKAVNIDGAQELGITGHVFTTPPALREFLVALQAE
ncbi:putative hydrolase of the HAD superfamily [Frondihabitans sp. PhB188]|uniref:HAD family hydrolase n=1 Tax=Frondihabitans sp. PhB188 TaxID=2485200 RepID=UPI000F463A1D|nr:HAD family phosphatase [Frondihabitans sp. PhB188]ROQ41362.1 putative hydrolase of the HAD superfamily [Frondihabitans sp. PhB188]